jgi:colicin import membrane protein
MTTYGAPNGKPELAPYVYYVKQIANGGTMIEWEAGPDTPLLADRQLTPAEVQIHKDQYEWLTTQMATLKELNMDIESSYKKGQTEDALADTVYALDSAKDLAVGLGLVGKDSSSKRIARRYAVYLGYDQYFEGILSMAQNWLVSKTYWDPKAAGAQHAQFPDEPGGDAVYPEKKKKDKKNKQAKQIKADANQALSRTFTQINTEQPAMRDASMEVALIRSQSDAHINMLMQEARAALAEKDALLAQAANLVRGTTSEGQALHRQATAEINALAQQAATREQQLQAEAAGIKQYAQTKYDELHAEAATLLEAKNAQLAAYEAHAASLQTRFSAQNQLDRDAAQAELDRRAATVAELQKNQEHLLGLGRDLAAEANAKIAESSAALAATRAEASAALEASRIRMEAINASAMDKDAQLTKLSAYISEQRKKWHNTEEVREKKKSAKKAKAAREAREAHAAANSPERVAALRASGIEALAAMEAVKSASSGMEIDLPTRKKPIGSGDAALGFVDSTALLRKLMLDPPTLTPEAATAIGVAPPIIFVPPTPTQAGPRIFEEPLPTPPDSSAFGYAKPLPTPKFVSKYPAEDVEDMTIPQLKSFLTRRNRQYSPIPQSRDYYLTLARNAIYGPGRAAFKPPAPQMTDTSPVPLQLNPLTRQDTVILTPHRTRSMEAADAKKYINKPKGGNVATIADLKRLLTNQGVPYQEGRPWGYYRELVDQAARTSGLLPPVEAIDKQVKKSRRATKTKRNTLKRSNSSAGPVPSGPGWKKPVLIRTLDGKTKFSIPELLKFTRQQLWEMIQARPNYSRKSSSFKKKIAKAVKKRAPARKRKAAPRKKKAAPKKKAPKATALHIKQELAAAQANDQKTEALIEHAKQDAAKLAAPTRKRKAPMKRSAPAKKKKSPPKKKVCTSSRQTLVIHLKTCKTSPCSCPHMEVVKVEKK